MSTMQPVGADSVVRRAGHRADSGRGRPVVRRVLAVLALCALAQGVHAGVFDDDEARKRIDQANQRIDKLQRDLEARLNTIEHQGLVDLLNQVEMLKAEVARLRGQLEVMGNDLEQAQKRQKDLYLDLDSRLRKFESVPAAGAAADAPGSGAVATGGPPAANGDAAPVAGAVPTGAEQRAYDNALDQFKRGDYPGAVASFSAFVKSYPRGSLAASAQYWNGNAQFARKDYRAAIAAQRQLLQSYPDSPKVPDAMLNIASAQSELGDNAVARRTLEDLIGKYPQSEAAVKAKQRLGQR
ncbi:MAG TPA: tol-pal system protein YbgF [Casimicrobiaceae bacterium]